MRRDAATPSHGVVPLEDARSVTDNFRKSSYARSFTLELPHAKTRQESLDLQRVEVGELHASRERLVLPADTGRRMIERDLDGRPQQHLIALVVNLQLARQLADTLRTTEA